MGVRHLCASLCPSSYTQTRKTELTHQRTSREVDASELERRVARAETRAASTGRDMEALKAKLEEHKAKMEQVRGRQDHRVPVAVASSSLSGCPCALHCVSLRTKLTVSPPHPSAPVCRRRGRVRARPAALLAVGRRGTAGGAAPQAGGGGHLQDAQGAGRGAEQGGEGPPEGSVKLRALPRGSMACT